MEFDFNNPPRVTLFSASNVNIVSKDIESSFNDKNTIFISVPKYFHRYTTGFIVKDEKLDKNSSYITLKNEKDFDVYYVAMVLNSSIGGTLMFSGNILSGEGRKISQAMLRKVWLLKIELDYQSKIGALESFYQDFQLIKEGHEKDPSLVAAENLLLRIRDAIMLNLYAYTIFKEKDVDVIGSWLKIINQYDINKEDTIVDVLRDVFEDKFGILNQEKKMNLTINNILEPFYK